MQIISRNSIKPSELLDKVRQIPGVDIKLGLSNCGSEDELISALKIFRGTMDGKAEEIRSYYDSGNWEYYTIKVHALKSSARLIGAASVSELAKALEDAGKAGNIDFIRENSDRLLGLFSDFKEKLHSIFQDLEKDSGEGAALGSDLIPKAYDELLKSIGKMDYENMERIMDNLERFDFPKEEQDRYEALKEAWLEMDYDQMTALLEKN